MQAWALPASDDAKWIEVMARVPEDSLPIALALSGAGDWFCAAQGYQRAQKLVAIWGLSLSQGRDTSRQGGTCGLWWGRQQDVYGVRVHPAQFEAVWKSLGTRLGPDGMAKVNVVGACWQWVTGLASFRRKDVEAVLCDMGWIGAVPIRSGSHFGLPRWLIRSPSFRCPSEAVGDLVLDFEIAEDPRMAARQAKSGPASGVQEEAGHHAEVRKPAENDWSDVRSKLASRQGGGGRPGAMTGPRALP
mmetsp:Transcript_32645/g.78456  ORF Transcript_32645/g.78456 Transcript_32645/m.78456 type:complete len:246 (+) Transcript_32645:444-1181(+)